MLVCETGCTGGEAGLGGERSGTMISLVLDMLHENFCRLQSEKGQYSLENTSLDLRGKFLLSDLM